MLIEALKALLIGIVEGITEWLPISSTGHMILVDEFVQLDVSPEFLELFLVLIQIGAIMAVVILYFAKLNPFSRTKTVQQRHDTWQLWAMVVVGCIPAAIFGFALDEWVNEHFYNKVTVASALIVYGIAFIVLELRNRRRYSEVDNKADGDGRAAYKSTGLMQGGCVDAQAPGLLDKDTAVQMGKAHLVAITDVSQINWKTALKIGFFQVLAIIPGTSRSGATIIGGMLCGCSRTAATEFTFFLAIPVMFGWGVLKALRFFLEGLVMTPTEITVLVVGMFAAFVVAVLAIKFLMGYIKKNDFMVFGIYRIIVGVVVLAYFAFETYGLLP